jgi:hypothetical protein
VSECIEWWGSFRPHGYGYFGKRRRAGEYAHRRIYEECFGLIPDGMVVHHECSNKRCVNPEHLSLTTHQEHPDAAPGQKRAMTTCRNGHPLFERDTYGRRFCRICTNARRRARWIPRSMR